MQVISYILSNEIWFVIGMCLSVFEFKKYLLKRSRIIPIAVGVTFLVLSILHTLFAAPLRTVLFKLGIQNAVIHVILGIAISFIGPMIAAIIMKKSKWLEFFLYPGKFIKMR